MRCYVYLPNMGKYVGKMLKLCKGYALAANAPPIKYNPWPNMDGPWLRIHVDFAGTLDGFYYPVEVESFTKCPDVFRCRQLTIEVTSNFLHKLFSTFGVVDCLVSENGRKCMYGNFKDFCDNFQVNHITIIPYHPRSKGPADRSVNTLKRDRK